MKQASLFLVVCSVTLTGCANTLRVSKPWQQYSGDNSKLYQNLIRQHENLRSAVRSKHPRVLFLGDSITQNWNDADTGLPAWNHYFAPKNCFNSGVGGATTQFTLWRLNHGALDNLSPEVVVLMIGSNNTVLNTPDDVFSGIRSVIQTLQKKWPRCKILVLSILPRYAGTIDSNQKDSKLRKNICIINQTLATIKDVDYLDVGDQFLDAHGLISPVLMPGGVHPSRRGYERIAPRIAAHLERLLD